jgi:predicted metal-dependent peptidase
MMSAFNTVAVTAPQKRAWEETVSMMTMQCPGFIHLMYSCLNHQSEDGQFVVIMSRDVPIAATDSLNIIVNPDTYFAMTLLERVYVAIHEVMHNVYFDVPLLHKCQQQGYVLMPDGRKLPFDNECLQKAMDARINAGIDEMKVGRRPAMGWFDDSVKGGDSVYPIYERYLQQQGGQSGNQPKPGQPGNGTTPGTQPKPGNGNPNNGFDKLLKPGEATGKGSSAKQNKEKWALETVVAQHLEETIAMKGELPAGMKRLFKQLLKPEISWIDVVEVDVKLQVGDGAVDWTQPHPWYGTTSEGDYFYPGETGYGCGWVVVWGDTSGSMSDRILARNIGELAGVLDQVRPKRLTLIWCDAALHEGSVVELNEGSDLRDLKPVGGGGTNYQPVLDWIAKEGRGEQPDLFLGFTDGLVTFPKHPHPFPTIWASSSKEGAVKYPFGKVVYINNIARAE